MKKIHRFQLQKFSFSVLRHFHQQLDWLCGVGLSLGWWCKVDSLVGKEGHRTWFLKCCILEDLKCSFLKWKGQVQMYLSLLVTHTGMVPPLLGCFHLHPTPHPGWTLPASRAGLSQRLQMGQEMDARESWTPQGRWCPVVPVGAGPHSSTGSWGRGLRLCVADAFGEGMSGSLMLQYTLQETRSAQGPANCTQYHGYWAELGDNHFISQLLPYSWRHVR